MPLTVIRPSELEDSHTLIGACAVRFQGHRDIESCTWFDVWDDGYGQVWAYRETFGIRGIVRARTWETAYECAQDELMSDAECQCPMKWNGHDEPTADDKRPSDDCPFHSLRMERDGLDEGYAHRSNGEPSNPRLHSHIASWDLNGQDLSALPDETDDDTRYYLVVDDGLEDASDYARSMDLDAFDAAQALYWYAANYHQGQSSELYSILSRLDYKPGAWENGPEADSTAEVVYSDLEAKAVDAEALYAWIERTLANRKD